MAFFPQEERRWGGKRHAPNVLASTLQLAHPEGINHEPLHTSKRVLHPQNAGHDDLYHRSGKRTTTYEEVAAAARRLEPLPWRARTEMSRVFDYEPFERRADAAAQAMATRPNCFAFFNAQEEQLRTRSGLRLAPLAPRPAEELCVPGFRGLGNRNGFHSQHERPTVPLAQRTAAVGPKVLPFTGERKQF